MASSLVFLALIAAAGPDVTVEPLEGKPIAGRLTELSAEKLVIETAAGPQALAPKELQSVQLGGIPVSERPQIWADLVDGSLLVGRSYQSAGGKASLETISGEKLDLPPRAVRAIRFQSQSPEIAAQWEPLLKAEATGDMVVLRKTTTRQVEEEGKEPKSVTETVLDQLEGTIQEASPAGAKFEFDGDKIDVKREKMEGIIFFQPTKRQIPAPVCKLRTTDGCVWSVRSLDLKGESVSITTTGGVSESLPLAGI